MLLQWCLCFALMSGTVAGAQGLPAFDAASVRPSNDSGVQRSNVPLDAGNVYATLGPQDSRTAAGGFLVATHQPLWRYISFAYKLSGTQELSLRFNMFSGAPKSGAPTWVTGGMSGGAESFDISARAPAETSIDTMRLMMRSLLAKRFHLTVHFTTADAAVFALVRAKSGVPGPKLHPHPASDTCDGPRAGLPPACGVIAHVASASAGQHFAGRGVPLDLLATSIPTMTGLAATPRPVVDQTGDAALYDFNLDWVHDMSADAGVVTDNAAAIRDALKSDLGLELKSSRAPVRFLIVDRVEKPTEN